MSDILDRFFRARSLAIIGASADPDKIGGRPLDQCLKLGFEGTIYPVNPSALEVQGLRSFASVEALPENLDCAVIVLPAKAVEAAVDACARKRFPLAFVLSSGFAEHSEEGRILQERITARACAVGMRLIGPNSMGGISFEHRISATFTSVNDHEGRAWPPLGSISIASQSGFVGSHLLGMFRDRGLGVAKWLATGNQADIDLADCIAHYARDDITRIIAIYLEGAGRADALREAFDLARANGKIVVALRAGRTELGARAVASHTASLVGGEEAYNAVFQRHGVIGAQSLDELTDIVAALDTQKRPRGPSMGVATVSGGFGILISDAASQNGFDLPELPPQRQQNIRAVNALATTRNPVDMGNLGKFEVAVGELLAQDYDSIALAIGHFGLLSHRMGTLCDNLNALRQRHPEKFIALVANLTEAWRRAFQQIGIFTCDDPARAVHAMAVLRDLPRSADIEDDPPPSVPVVDARPLIARADERSGRELLRQIGVAVVLDELAIEAQQAAAIARGFAAPVALKIASPDILHKSDIGGVELGLTGDAAVAAAFERIMQRARAAHPDAHIDGIIVSPMVTGGVETIVGVKRDDVFGPIVMFGLGGIFVEVFRDTAFGVAPFGPKAAREMIRSVRSYPLLAGARGHQAVDIDALAETLSRVSVFAHRNADLIESIDINPLVALPTCVVALDALIVAREASAVSSPAV